MHIVREILIVLFWLSAFVIVWAMIGYNFSLRIIGKLFSGRQLKKDRNFRPTVTVIVAAYNEEKVIADKLSNLISNDYPKDRIEYIIISDRSTDRTDEIVKDFIEVHPNLRMKFLIAREHKGKTNAQNEAQKYATGEILVMTDANSFLEENSISELVSCFTDEDIAYVCGRLKYINADSSVTADLESTYWEGDLQQREIESRIQTITAGNGAIYACRNSEYYDFDPLYGHDSVMPVYYASKNLRAIYNPDAVAYEKAGEVIKDEFKRKVRINRVIFHELATGVKTLNIFKYKWFSYFYFGHKICRHLLWLAHTVLLILSVLLANTHWIFALAFAGQILFYFLAIINSRLNMNVKLLNMVTYYSITVLAQWQAVINCMTGKNEPTWESAESTR